MFDIQLIRDDLTAVAKGLEAKSTKADLNRILDCDQKRKELLLKVDDLRALQNKANDEIGKLIKDGADPKEKIASMKSISKQISEIEPDLKSIESELKGLLLTLPNLADESVPVGDISKNQVVRSWAEEVKYDFKPKTHIEIAEGLDIIDFKRATKISGSNFTLFKGLGAKLERALYCFMLDVHTSEHGYTEVLPSYLVNRESMTGTGQLPKMEEDMYKVQDDLYLIPTAEVPVTNIHRDEILAQEDLPIKYTAYSACFRREAGSYGKDTKGLNRVHQFDKVELVKFVHPEQSYAQLEELVTDAEKIFQLLNMPYRVVLLASGDLSFAAAKCFDIESHACGLDRWLEVSSCSNFEDFQARRSNIRFKGKEDKKPSLVHTLNGSGIALARTMAIILENNQTETGSVIIPEVLRPYMGGIEEINAK